MVSLVKAALYKVVGPATLAFAELQEVILDIMTTLNNRPLSYCEDDLQLPTLTPNILIFGRANYIIEQQPANVDDRDMRRRAKYLMKCKEALWKRWQAEYLRALRERHNLKHDGKQGNLANGDVVLIKGESKNRGKWKIGIVEEMVPGRDGVVRVVKLRAGQSHMERPIQFLYPMELHCEPVEERVQVLDATAEEFRPGRRAAIDARNNISGTLEYESEEEM